MKLAIVVGLAVSMVAQNSASDSARYQVGYVSVGPSSVNAFRNAFDQYRDASRGELGFVSYEALEQIGKPGDVVVIETWRDQAAADAHGRAASKKRFLDALDPIRVSGYDERPYKTFAVRPGPRASAASVIVVTHVDVVPPGDPTTLLRRLAEDSRAEPGCLRFDILQHAARPNHFTIVEAWRDLQAHDVHAAADHTRQYRDVLQPLIGSPLDERLMRTR